MVTFGGYMRIDPKLQKCSCGYCFTPSLLLKVRLLFGDVVVTCPRCQSKMLMRLVYHVVCIDRRSVNRKDLWRNG